jgi:glycosyltransferase involved in cell wall biosynthesis
LTNAPRIVGISLVRNEDLFVETAVSNAATFCDQLYIADHGSTDGTSRIVHALARDRPNIHLRTVRHPAESQDLIRHLAGSRTWIFGVDGDEIYEPDRLARLRGRILSGDFDKCWMVFGNVLHVTKLDDRRRTASGHLAPPCRSMTKLYNFNAIEEWKGYTPERLHGGTIRFRAGYSRDHRRMLHEEVSWHEAEFRCLHLCFLKRSSRDRENALRRNIIETFGPTRLHTLWYAFTALMGFKPTAEWKRSRYMRGPEITVVAETFFPQAA